MVQFHIMKIDSKFPSVKINVRFLFFKQIDDVKCCSKHFRVIKATNGE